MTEPGEVEVAGAEPPAEPKTFAGKWWFWAPWPALVALDLWSKSAVFAFMADKHPLLPEERRPPHVVWEGAVQFDLVTWGNTGTVWGLSLIHI